MESIESATVLTCLEYTKNTRSIKNDATLWHVRTTIIREMEVKHYEFTHIVIVNKTKKKKTLN